MPVKLIGRATNFKGKPLWEILGNLKNFGIGRLVIRNTFQRYSEPCYMKILKVGALPVPDKPHEDRKVMVLVEKTFRGITNPKPVQLDSVSYKADYMLIPKDQEHRYLQANVPISEKKILPRTTEFPPLLTQMIMHQMKANGVAHPEKPKLSLRYNFTNNKNYRLAEEGETPTVELNFSVDMSNSLFDDIKQTTST